MTSGLICLAGLLALVYLCNATLVWLGSRVVASTFPWPIPPSRARIMVALWVLAAATLALKTMEK